MKLLSEVKKETLFDRKVQVELSLAEVAVIRAVFAKQSVTNLQSYLNQSGFEDLANEVTGNSNEKDLSWNLYTDSGEILEEFGIDVD